MTLFKSCRLDIIVYWHFDISTLRYLIVLMLKLPLRQCTDVEMSTTSLYWCWNVHHVSVLISKCPLHQCTDVEMSTTSVCWCWNAITFSGCANIWIYKDNIRRVKASIAHLWLVSKYIVGIRRTVQLVQSVCFELIHSVQCGELDLYT